MGIADIYSEDNNNEITKSSSNWNRTSKKPHELYLLTKNSYRTKCKNQNI